MRYLLFAVVLGFIFRLFFIDIYPTGFTPDEAAFGYNAYTLINTGRDEWGTPFYELFHTNLESFGDYKLPLYSFLAVPTIKFFGLSEVGTRIPNAIVGVLSIISVYLLSRNLFKENKMVANVSTIFMALSPWSIQMSRGAFEANLVTLFVPLFLSSVLQKKILLSVLLLVINFYSYHSARFISLLLTPFLFVKNTNKLPLVILILMIPGLFSFISSGKRVSDVGVFNPTDNWQSVSDKRFDAVINGSPDFFARIFSNKITYIFDEVINRYLTYFSPQFLFSSGPAETTYGMQPGYGVLYLFQIVLLVFFIIKLIKSPSKELFILLVFILISPIAASLSKGPGYSANRSIAMLPFILIASSVGYSFLIEKFSSYRRVLNYSLVVLIFVSFLSFFENYYFHSKKDLAEGMMYGYSEAFDRSKSLFNQYDEVRISRSLSEPHIFLAFFTKFSPVEYQNYSRDWAVYASKGYSFLDQLDGYRLGKFRFGDIKYEEDSTKSILYIGRPEDFPKDVKKYFEIQYPNGKSSIVVANK